MNQRCEEDVKIGSYEEQGRITSLQKEYWALSKRKDCRETLTRVMHT